MTAAIIGSFIGTTISLIILIAGCYLYDSQKEEKYKS